MARGYPRFLFSNPQNTKSEGPFLVHCLSPRFIGKVIFKKSKVKPAEVEILMVWDDAPPELYIVMKGQAETWLKSQIISGEIEL